MQSNTTRAMRYLGASITLCAAAIGAALMMSAPAEAHCGPCCCAPPPPPPCECEAPKQRGRAEFSATVLFASGSHTLDAEAIAVTDAAGKALKMFADELVLVAGHTDDVGRDDANRVLSIRRALAVSDRLQSMGVSAGRISMEGFGESQPVASNRTAAGRAKNRRVEVSIK